MTATAELPIDGLKYDAYIEIEGETFRATAEGPSFHNGQGRFKLEKVNGLDVIRGSINRRSGMSFAGGLCLTAYRSKWSAYFSIENLALGVAFGRMCADEGFREVVGAVEAGR